MEEALVLWLNSTLGILNSLAHRVPTRGPWIEFKKPFLRTMPVPDLRAMSRRQLSEFSGLYRRISELEVRRIADLSNDTTRNLIDRGISEILGVGSVISLRESLSVEPIVTGVPLARETVQDEEQIQFAL